MLRVSQLAVLVLAAASAAAAATPAPCPEQSRGTLDEWKCYGEVDFTARAEGAAPVGAHFVVFANGERLYEKREAAAAKSVLMGAGWSLYRGLTREDSTVVGAHHPFIFFEFALFTPLIVLAASGQAPSSIADGTTAVAYTVDSRPIGMLREIGIRSVKGTIERHGPSYSFSAESTGNVATGLLELSVRGRWSAEAVQPYADSMALEDWRYHCTPNGPDVRGNHRAVPAGVTLGDVRRGWRGSCN